MDVVQQIITRVPAWHNARDIQIERIAGLTNENYRVSVNGESFALRVSGQNTGRLGINREGEFAALQTAAAAGIGAEVVAFLPPEGHLVTRWVEGCHWNAKEFRTREHVSLLTETVKRIHALVPNGATFSPFTRVTAYREIAGDFGALHLPGLDSFLQTMTVVQADQKRDPSDWQRFCHNDLVSVNYLFSQQEQSIKVLDWEFAGVGDIYYDLASLVYTHDSDGPISPELEEVMLNGYFGKITPHQRRRLLGMKYMVMLFTGMWGLAQHGMQKAGLVPVVEGFDYLEFAQYLFGHDILELQAQFNHVSKAA